ncbi:Histone acetyltransferase, ELP3 family [candidate division SR1 bacterium RAAC1_SR1_1]|nr:Histone acetyltransferase, ELP3 family [candidate division SR1 bacterium RAAC1_SR1_1]
MLKEDIIYELYQSPSLEKLKELKKNFSQINKLKDLVSNVALIQTYRDLLATGKITANKEVEQLLKKRSIRSESGIVAVQVLTKPFWCPGNCIFCPNDPEMPKSYIKTEPGAARALLNQFDPVKQAYNRLKSLNLSGHDTDKIEMIVLGGTWDVYPEDYKIEFIKGLYDACNTFDQLEIDHQGLDEVQEDKRYKYTITNQDTIKYSKTIEEAIEINETAPHRIIGLTIETRPEYVTDANCQLRRKLGVTRLEIGIQSMYDDVLAANKRGHTVAQIETACHKLRQYGFKFCVHIMPGLYKSSLEKDIGTFQQIYDNPYIKPDEIKFYPTSVIPNTELFNLYKSGEYKPLETEEIAHIIETTLTTIIPPYTRIKRLIRDIPATEIAAGSNVTNLNQLVHTKLQNEQNQNIKSRYPFFQRLYGDFTQYATFDEYLASKDEKQTSIIGVAPDLTSSREYISLDTRSREIRHNTNHHEETANLVIRKYLSSVGAEYFISFEDSLGYLYGFARLLLPKEGSTIDREGLGANTALIRELHVYGNLQSLKKAAQEQGVQHTGFGKQLMHIAEQIAQSKKYIKLSVISGVGVKQYYEKIGYTKEGTYVVKKFK